VSGGIYFEDVSKFYGEVLGVNRVTLAIGPGVTSLVGPNGAGKTTLLNLMTGLVRPSRGRVSVLGISPEHPEQLFRRTGYATQYDAFPRGLTGYDFLYYGMRLHGAASAEAGRAAWQALRRVGLEEAARRKIAAYSKGMRQRLKLAQALAQDPEVLVLDEPLNGLDPIARAQTLALLKELASQGRYVVVSSHILHELDRISDAVVLIDGGFIVAEGRIGEVRDEVKDQPARFLIRTPAARQLAARLMEAGAAVEARLGSSGGSAVVGTRNAADMLLALNRLAVELGADIETVAPVDADVESLYQYLVGAGGGFS
jgi:ABC-2 type transport system ATP-binding protein